ncbi:hypothetical protein LCGC14_0427310 [marine sediment metagenome]|uniref:Uncharacterized protein n=1 Tax=marine sediment metagenome TaxID=412755 RepID=A0A0F9SVI4_9ZZZZ
MKLKLKPDSEEKVYSILRSLFRYSKLVKMSAPDILFENEGKMINARIRDMTPVEIFLAVTSWEEYSKEQEVQDEIQNEKLSTDLDLYYQSLN